jgi:diguanylate cyclase (GGDEF)-like protein/PAS domain S-box-containing protein
VDAIVTADVRGRILTINPATTRMFGFSSEELIGQPVTVLMTIADRAEHESAVRRYLATGQAKIMGSVVEALARRKDGSIFPIDLSISEARAGDDTVFIGVVRDITERKRVESELQKAKAVAEDAATRDPLTGLWNHNRIIEILDEEIARVGRQRSTLSVAMMDLDRFKQINDTHGHVVGDEVLREVAKRLADAIRAYDSVGRFGGEEFMIVLPGADAQEAAEACERIRRRIGREPVVTSAGMLELTTSLGVVTRDGATARDATDLLVAADTALYRSKEAGRDRVTVSVAAGGVPD